MTTKKTSKIRVGDKVECYDDGHDIGRVIELEGDVATVAWDSGVQTPVQMKRLTRIAG